MKNIPGPLDYSRFQMPAKPAAASAESGVPPAAASSFHDMSQDEQKRAIHSLANDGHGDHEIARLCGLHVEMIRRVLATVEHDEAAAAHARAWAQS